MPYVLPTSFAAVAHTIRTVAKDPRCYFIEYWSKLSIRSALTSIFFRLTYDRHCAERCENVWHTATFE